MPQNLPIEYDWLKWERGPKILIEALKRFGTLEAPGKANNPIILQWAKEIGVAEYFKTDETPWCGLFIGVCARAAGKEIVESPLWAKSWLNWGTKQIQPMLGDVLVFERDGGGGHVGLYVGQDDEAYHVLGGNQSDRVCITRIAKHRLLATRRSMFKTAQPPNVRVVKLSPKGALSKNEA